MAVMVAWMAAWAGSSFGQFIGRRAKPERGSFDSLTLLDRRRRMRRNAA